MPKLFPVVAGYDLREIVGRGGEATIYEAVDERHGRSVAVKVIDGQAFDDGQRRAFTRELQSMGRLGDHPHVVNVFDSGFTEAGRPFLVMPLLRKGTMSARVENRGPLAVGELLELGIKIGSALETAHRRGILHCDVKPNNLLIGPWDEPMLADFGISSITNIGLTSTNRISLTVMYAAPEILDEQPPTVASDIYSFGATLYTLAAGEPAYGGVSPASVMKNQLRKSAPPRLDGTLPPELVALVAEMMDHDPSVRPKSAARIVSRLQALQQQYGVAPTAAVIGDPIDERISGAGSTGSAPALHKASTGQAALDRALPVPGTAPVPGGAQPPSVTQETIAGDGSVGEGESPGRTMARKAAIITAALLAVAGLIYLITRPGEQATTPAPGTEPSAVGAPTTEEVPSEPTTAEPAQTTRVPAVVVPAAEPTTAPTTPMPDPPSLESTTDLPDLQVNFASAAAPAPVVQPIPAAADPATFAILDRPFDEARSQPNGAHFGNIFSTSWSSSGLIATGGSDQSARIWDADGALLLDIVHESEIQRLAWSPDGARLAVASRQSVVIWDMVTGESISLPLGAGVGELDWSSDGTRLAGGAWKRILLWDALTGDVLFVADSDTGSTVSIDLADDGRILVGAADGYVLEWDSTVLADPSVVAVFPDAAYDATVGYLDPSVRGGEIFVGMPDQPILFLDTDTKTVVRSLVDLWHPVGLYLSPDRSRMISIGQTSLVRLWDLERGEIIEQFVPTFPNAFSASWAPGGQAFVTVGNEGKAFLYNISDVDRVTTIELRVS